MKTAAVVLSYHLTRHLKGVLKHLSTLDKVLVINERLKGVKEQLDKTEAIVKKLNQPNVELITGEGSEQHEVLNKGIQLLDSYDMVFINDADEFIIPRDRNRIIEKMIDSDADAGFCNVIDYFNMSLAYPMRGHKAVVVVKPKNVKFYDNRCLQFGSGVQFDGMFIHHFGFAMGEDSIKWKLKVECYAKDRKEIDFIINQDKQEKDVPKAILQYVEEKELDHE